MQSRFWSSFKSNFKVFGWCYTFWFALHHKTRQIPNKGFSLQKIYNTTSEKDRWIAMTITYHWNRFGRSILFSYQVITSSWSHFFHFGHCLCRSLHLSQSKSCTDNQIFTAACDTYGNLKSGPWMPWDSPLQPLKSTQML